MLLRGCAVGPLTNVLSSGTLASSSGKPGIGITVTLDTVFSSGDHGCFLKARVGTVSGTWPVSADICRMDSVLFHLAMFWAQMFQQNRMVIRNEITYSCSKLKMRRNIKNFKKGVPVMAQ